MLICITMNEDTNTLIKSAAIDIMILTTVWGLINLKFNYYNMYFNYFGSHRVMPMICLGHLFIGASISAYFIAEYI